jgi:hypothetical protein
MIPAGKKYFILSSMLVGFFVSACAQMGTLVKAQAFYKLSFPGTVMRDIDGKEVDRGVDTVYQVYVEIKGNTRPVIDSVFIKGRPFTAVVYPLTKPEYAIGNRKSDERRVVLQPAKGNSLWRLEISPVPGAARTKKSFVLVLLKGRKAGKNLTYTITRLVELSPDIHG